MTARAGLTPPFRVTPTSLWAWARRHGISLEAAISAYLSAYNRLPY